MPSFAFGFFRYYGLNRTVMTERGFEPDVAVGQVDRLPTGRKGEYQKLVFIENRYAVTGKIEDLDT